MMMGWRRRSRTRENKEEVAEERRRGSGGGGDGERGGEMQRKIKKCGREAGEIWRRRWRMRNVEEEEGWKKKG